MTTVWYTVASGDGIQGLIYAGHVLYYWAMSDCIVFTPKMIGTLPSWFVTSGWVCSKEMKVGSPLLETMPKGNCIWPARKTNLSRVRHSLIGSLGPQQMFNGITFPNTESTMDRHLTKFFVTCCLDSGIWIWNTDIIGRRNRSPSCPTLVGKWSSGLQVENGY